MHAYVVSCSRLPGTGLIEIMDESGNCFILDCFINNLPAEGPVSPQQSGRFVLFDARIDYMLVSSEWLLNVAKTSKNNACYQYCL
jgi:hypothetical protein